MPLRVAPFGLCFLASVLLAALASCGPSPTPSTDDGGERDRSERRCGDGVCGDEEDCESCASDCGECPWPAAWIALEREVLTLVNEVRASGASCGGEPVPSTHPLVWDEQLALAARLHSLDMAEQDYFDHISLDGRTPGQRMQAAGYTGFGFSENIAVGSQTPRGVMQSWMSSPGHCRNIMSDRADELGVGYALEPDSTWRHYWTQNFGQR